MRRPPLQSLLRLLSLRLIAASAISSAWVLTHLLASAANAQGPAVSWQQCFEIEENTSELTSKELANNAAITMGAWLTDTTKLELAGEYDDANAAIDDQRVVTVRSSLKTLSYRDCAPAQAILAFFAAGGLGITIPDPSLALTWAMRAALLGYEPAKTAVALMTPALSDNDVATAQSIAASLDSIPEPEEALGPVVAIKDMATATRMQLTFSIKRMNDLIIADDDPATAVAERLAAIAWAELSSVLTASTTPKPETEPSNDVPLEAKLVKLKKLVEKGLITEEEAATKRARLLEDF
jgi:hypothetical protein